MCFSLGCLLITSTGSIGFVGAKISYAYAPADGDKGFEKNVQIYLRKQGSQLSLTFLSCA